MAWTKKDRVMAAFSGETPDITPIFDYMINDGVFEHYLGRPVIPGEREAILRATSKCLDLCHPMPVAYEPKEEILPNGTRRVLERWMAWNSHKTRADEELSKDIKKEIEGLENPRHWLYSRDTASWRKEAEERNEWAGEMVYIHQGLWVPLLPGRTIEEQSFYLADYPELCDEWHRLMLKGVLYSTEIYSKEKMSPVAIIWVDIAMKGGLIYPPEVLDKYFFPGLREQMSILHSHGIKGVFHSDGDVSAVMDKLIDCGIDGFNPLEISAGMDVSHFFERYGKKVTLVGGLDAVDVLAFGNPESVAAATKKIIREAAETGSGLIIGSSSGEIDNSMPVGNVMAYFNAVWETKNF